MRQIGVQLGVNPRNVVNWVQRAAADSGPTAHHAEPADASSLILPPAPAVDAFRMRPTIQDVAKRAQVSSTTISNYINDKGRMGAETRRRINEAIDALHFTPNSLMRAIRQRRTRILGVLTFGLSDEEGVDEGRAIIPEILRGINSAADTAEHELLLYTGWPQRAYRYSGLNFLSGHVDGLIWIGPALQEPIFDRVADARLPSIAVLTRHTPEGVGYVNAENVESMREVVNYLAGLGHKKIAFAGPIDSSNFIDRHDGYRRALAETGLAYNDKFDATMAKRYLTMPAYDDLLADLLSQSSRPTAIVTVDDTFAMRTIDYLTSRNIRVPEDISVTGFNGTRFSTNYKGGITTVAQPFREIGRVAVERLIALIEGGPVEECRITLPTKLQIGCSTGPASPAPQQLAADSGELAP